MRKYIYTILLVSAILLAGCGVQDNLISEVSEASVETQHVVEDIVSETPSAIVEDILTVSSEPIQAKTLSIVMVGDILLHDLVEKASLQEDGTYGYEAIFAHTKEDIQKADLAIVNQEVILGGQELGVSGYPAFNAPFSVGEALVDAGFDVICHGTNHALDKGQKGLLNCINFWKDSYPQIAVLGIHDSQASSDNIYLYEQDDFKIAILNYTYGTNGIPMPEGMPYAVDLLEENSVVADIQKAEALADFTIVCPHWGTEYQLQNSATQEKWAKLFVENGVDLVLGTHPHVIQPISWVRDDATGHEMLVYYSLGNFVNWTGESGAGIANRMVGGMAKVTLSIVDDKVVISEYGIEPVVSHLEQGVNGVTVYKLSDYTEELAKKNQIRLQDDAFSFAYCKELCNQVFGQSYFAK